MPGAQDGPAGSTWGRSATRSRAATRPAARSRAHTRSETAVRRTGRRTRRVAGGRGVGTKRPTRARAIPGAWRRSRTGIPSRGRFQRGRRCSRRRSRPRARGSTRSAARPRGCAAPAHPPPAGRQPGARPSNRAAAAVDRPPRGNNAKTPCPPLNPGSLRRLAGEGREGFQDYSELA